MPHPTEPEPDPSDAVALDRDFDADAASVWETLTTDDGFSSWSGAGSRIDPRPGGALCTPDDATGRARVGAVEHVDPGRHLRFRWWPVDDPDTVSTVDIDLVPLPTGTQVRIIERLALPAGTPQCSAGWARRARLLVATRIRA